jgi:2-polyprenyl-6-hydroxyphenyl methylase/3-demethylubiquinone-9 3-methyltransferase
MIRSLPATSAEPPAAGSPDDRPAEGAPHAVTLMARPTTVRSTSTIDPAEVARFSALAAEWWDANGPMRPLHKLNPIRLGWIKEQIAWQFARDEKDPAALAGLRVLDVGCGAGLVTEPLRRMGAEVVGIDPSPETIAVARHHAGQAGLAIDYRTLSAEALAASGERFDVVLALEVVEHVTDLNLFVETCAQMVKPDGLMIVATISRTLKAFLFAIIGAEYVLQWLPRGTHSYDRLVTPHELAAAFAAAGLSAKSETGLMYVPFADYWRLSTDLDVNYMMSAERRA